MNFFDQEPFENESRFLQNEDIHSRIKTAYNLIKAGKCTAEKEFLEDTIDDCIENQKFHQGLILTSELLKYFPYDSELWLRKGICLGELNQNKKALRRGRASAAGACRNGSATCRARRYR